MTEKVRKIREEIERKLEVMQYQIHRKDAYKELESILNYIDTLQEDNNTSDWLKELEEMPDEQVKERLEKVNAWYNEQFANKEPVSEDLENAVNAYIGYAPDVDESSSVYGERQAFKAGAKWKNEQMMAKSIDAHCFGFQGAAALFTFRLPAGIHLVGSKVKVIVIKEE